MSRVLLISETYFRSHVDVSESILSKTVITAIEDTQSMELANIIGDKLLFQLYHEVETDSLTDANRLLLDRYIQPFLVAQTASKMVNKINYKIGNLGTINNDKTVYPKEIGDYYANLAGASLERLTSFMAHHFADYSQYLNGVEGFKSHLDASEDTGIFLGMDRPIKYPVDTGYRR